MEINEQEVRYQLREAKELYQKTKAAALRMYLDPIDFPEEIKYRLRYLSRKKVRLSEMLKQ